MSIEIFTLIVVAVGFSFLSIKLLQMRSLNKKLMIELAQSLIDKNILETKLVKNEEHKIENSSEFTAFLSQSRDWAFEYIENVQEKISLMVEDMAQDVAYFKEFGILTSEYPNHDIAEKFVVHYDVLKDMIPDKEKDA